MLITLLEIEHKLTRVIYTLLRVEYKDQDRALFKYMNYAGIIEIDLFWVNVK